MRKKHVIKRHEPSKSNNRGPWESNIRPADKPPENIQNIYHQRSHACTLPDFVPGKNQSMRCRRGYLKRADESYNTSRKRQTNSQILSHQPYPYAGETPKVLNDIQNAQIPLTK